jgi:hypothetical protein
MPVLTDSEECFVDNIDALLEYYNPIPKLFSWIDVIDLGWYHFFG